MGRGDNPRAGVDTLRVLRESGVQTRLAFFTRSKHTAQYREEMELLGVTDVVSRREAQQAYLGQMVMEKQIRGSVDQRAVSDDLRIPLKTFICYAYEDFEVVDGLKKHLLILEKKGLLQIWLDGVILAGEHWDEAIKNQLEQAEIILLFISVDFINSDYIESSVLQAALQRHREGRATLIPIIVRPCHWAEYFDLGQFQALPSKARPILSSHFPNRDEAFKEISQSIKKVAEELIEQKKANAESLAAANHFYESGQEKLNQGDYLNASLDLEKAWKQYLGLREYFKEAISLHAMGSAFLGLGNLQIARNNFEKAHDLFNQLDDKQNQSETLKSLSRVSRQMGDLSKAKEYIQSALVLDQTLGNWGFTMHELGEVNEAMGNLDAAEKCYREALETLEEEINDDRAWVDTQEALGRLAFKRGDNQRAWGYYQQVLSTVEASDDKKRHADVLATLAEVEIMRNNLSQATSNARQAKVIYADLEDKENDERMSKMLLSFGQREEETAGDKEEAIKAKGPTVQNLHEMFDPFHNLMIPVKGGTFQMGSNEYDREKPIHEVTIADFLLCKYPVTQRLWKQIMGENPSHFKGDDLPVENVSWDDTQSFLKKLNERLPAVQKPRSYRLPTEAEWEYAARGGIQSKGYKYAGSNDLEKVGWYNKNAGSKTNPVGQKKANELGLFDMSGNVWEWCQDVWHGDYEGAPKDGSAREQSGESKLRVVRGGSWDDDPFDFRAAARDGEDPDNRTSDCGFRLAR